MAAAFTNKVSEAAVPNVQLAVATTGDCSTMLPVLESRMSPPVPEGLEFCSCRLERSPPGEAVPAVMVTCPPWDGRLVPELSPATRIKLPAGRQELMCKSRLPCSQPLFCFCCKVFVA